MINVILQINSILYVQNKPEIRIIMKAVVQLDNLISEYGKDTIERNLGRIMEIRVKDIDIQKRLMCFFFQNPSDYDKVERELERIGYPIKKVMNKAFGVKKKDQSPYEKWEGKLE